MPKDNPNPSTEDIAAQIATLRTDMATLSQSVGQLVAARAEDAKRSAEAKLTNGARAASDAAEHLGEMASDSIRRQPVTATAIAAAMGFAVGYMANRR